LDVHSVPQEGLSGSPDDKVLFAAFSEDRALVTLDLDFSNSIRFPPAGKPGVIILRPALPLLSQLRQLAMEAIAYMKTESPRDSIGSLSRGAFAFSRLRWMQDNRKEQKVCPELKGTRYDWFKNEAAVEPGQKPEFDVLRTSTLATARAYHIKTMLQELYEQHPDDAEAWFRRWYYWATHSRLEPVVRVAKTLQSHFDGIIRWFKSGLSNGLLEGINSLIQSAKARARGFRSARKMKTIIYLLLSKLDFRLPSAVPN
jgi:predicted nuclease of predicted toxin-antitoxin system